LAEVDKKQKEISKLKLALGVVWAVLQHERKVLRMQLLAVAASEQPRVVALSWLVQVDHPSIVSTLQ